ncbi:hypothetical protein SAMN05216464_103381 [Mucilaginibacter pineti]|uniref:Uncharacterized protein n=1 Tax=Mucilaginibacter pineti TaxID=1391627 RepID=A0A1G6ZIQ3_9SPHI|nr:hypothetical protein [Mucilaginibacter pineti]SDE02624.1 hypothetical protein SAMN05216464_103381 [Mucilaginibacter pineti]
MPYHASTYIPGDSSPSVRLKCGNLRTAFLAFSLLCWVFILVFLCEMGAHCALPKLSSGARAVNDFFGNSTAFMAGPAIVLATLLYFAWGRKTLTWYNGVLIDDEPVAVLHYQFKSLFPGTNLIYLQSASRVWIIYPVTSQDNVKFKNLEVLKEETAYNEIQVGLLKDKLAASGATEKRFWFLTKSLVISLVILVLIMIVALSGI